MGGLHAVEDRPTPKEVYNWRLYTEALIIATGSLLQVLRRHVCNNRCANTIIALDTTQPLWVQQLPVRASKKILVSPRLQLPVFPAISHLPFKQEHSSALCSATSVSSLPHLVVSLETDNTA